MTVSGLPQGYTKRQIIGEYTSGNYRPIRVCSSGEIIICSGLYVVADVEVIASSGLIVNISGQHVHLESGDVIDTYVKSGSIMDIQSGLHVVVSGQPVTISGDHVFVESGIARLHGYHPASGIWVPLAVTLSGCLAMTYCSSGGLF